MNSGGALCLGDNVKISSEYFEDEEQVGVYVSKLKCKTTNALKSIVITGKCNMIDCNALAAEIVSSTTLEELKMTDLGCETTKASIVIFNALAKLSSKCSKLKSFYFSTDCCYEDPNLLDAIASMIRNNSTIRVLQLYLINFHIRRSWHDFSSERMQKQERFMNSLSDALGSNLSIREFRTRLFFNKHQLANIDENNGSLTYITGSAEQDNNTYQSNLFRRVCNRNQKMHAKAANACLFVILAAKRSGIIPQRDMRIMIAQHVVSDTS